ncbi:MAG: hypothetical protein RLZZ69_2239, partial [Cyanobacteriota bacterium]
MKLDGLNLLIWQSLQRLTIGIRMAIRIGKLWKLNKS